MGIDIEEIGSFHIGGRAVSLTGLPLTRVSMSPGMAPVDKDPNGEFHVEQMYVQFVRLAQPRARFPLLLWHGGGLTGTTWETTPDGRPGWQMYFLRAGHDVYVSDAVERGRASFAHVPQVWPNPPMFRASREAWELFRFGPDGSYSPDPTSRTPHPGQQFPVGAFDRFIMQAVPRWLDHDRETQAAYDALIGHVGPCVVIAHSQGCNFAFAAARANPGLVKAVIAIEPSGAPSPDLAALRSLTTVPHLMVWGDYLDRHKLWTDNIMKTPARYHAALMSAGVPSDWVELPLKGIQGNSHMLMMDANSDRVADWLQAWMLEKGLMQTA